MKIKSTLSIIVGLALLALSPRTRAQCTQTCDNQNTAFGFDALEPDPGPFGNDTAIGDQALAITTGGGNTAVGTFAGSIVVTGQENTAVGDAAMGDFVLEGSNASFNTAIGSGALAATSADNNTAVGYQALGNNDSGNNNTANGYQALYTNQTGNDNVATGRGALFTNTASNNTADGSLALNKNTSGTDNVAVGRTALFNNTTGSDNVAIGRGALSLNKSSNQSTACSYKALNLSTGGGNTATGYEALLDDTTGVLNSATGEKALLNNTTGFANSAMGDSALIANTTGILNIGIGFSAGSALTTGGNNIDIGNPGVAAEGNTIRVGTSGTQTNAYVAGINGVTVAGGIGVIIDSNGHLGTSTSSARYKENIQPMDKASEAILALQPVTFRYKKELDPQSIPQFGLVAEQVEKVDPKLVARDDTGKPYSVRYEAVNAMLLNEFLKEHRKVEQLQSAIAQQQSTNAGQQKEIDFLKGALEAQVARIQQISDAVALRRSTASAVATNR